MNPTKLKLTNPTDDELSAAVAERVAGWRCIPSNERRKEVWENAQGRLELDGHWFATSAGAVLPLLEKFGWVDIGCDPDYLGGPWHVAISETRESDSDIFSGTAKNLARAACIALLRANGIEVEVTP